MSYKEWTAIVQLVGVGLIGYWLVNDLMTVGIGHDPAAVATKLLWAIGGVIVFNIVALIVVAIVLSIIQREEFKDEADDERDRAISGKSHRNASTVTSILCVVALANVAFGVDPAIAVYALFVAPFIGGATDAVSRLVYYRIG